MKTSVKYYHLAFWAQGQMTWAKKVQSYSTYDVTHKKSEMQKPRIFFFIADSKTCRLIWGFGQLSSALGKGAMDLQNTCKQLDFTRATWFRPAPIVLNHVRILTHQEVVYIILVRWNHAWATIFTPLCNSV